MFKELIKDDSVEATLVNYQRDVAGRQKQKPIMVCNELCEVYHLEQQTNIFQNLQATDADGEMLHRSITG